MKVVVTLTARGEYPREKFPEDLAAALAGTVSQHLIAYGVIHVAVDIDLGIEVPSRAIVPK